MIPSQSESLPLLTQISPQAEIVNYSVGATLQLMIKSNDVIGFTELVSKNPHLVVEYDEHKVTPLHYCASSNNIQIALILFKHLPQNVTVEEYVNFKGGEMEATPVLWAIRHGADLNVKDKQNFTVFHMCCMQNDLLMFIYLLSVSNCDINNRDCFGQTALHWIVYKNFSDPIQWITLLSLWRKVDMNPYDQYGMTPLHWAIMQKNSDAILALVINGADIDLKTIAPQNSVSALVAIDKSARDLIVQKEDKNYGLIWYNKILEKAEKENNDEFVDGHFTRTERQILWLVPCIYLIIIFFALDILPWYGSLILAVGLGITLNVIVTRYILKDYHKCTISPLLASVILGSIIIAIYAQIFYILPYIHNVEYLLIWMLSILVATICIVNFALTSSRDPGILKLRKPGILRKNNPDIPLDQLEKEVKELSDKGIFDERYFCTTCLIRKPIRSKHCRHSDVCIALFDHYCPWVGNAVGRKNHLNFFIFVVTLIIGMNLMMILISHVVGQDQLTDKWMIEGCRICEYFRRRTSLCVLFVWTGINQIFGILVLFTQVYYISIGLTTNEFINSWRYWYLKARGENGFDKFYNPFDVGCYENWRYFLNEQVGEWKHVDWEKTFDIPLRYKDSTQPV